MTNSLTNESYHLSTVPRMRTNPFARAIAMLYPRLPFRSRWFSIIVRLEGGDMTSLTGRQILKKYHGVDVGPYSYGALVHPGAADVGTTIGAYTSIGSNVWRFGAGHPKDALTLHPYWYNPRLGLVPPERDVARTSCTIGDDVWIGSGVIILPQCRRVGTGAIVGAGSVVTKDVEEFAIVAGNPARKIGMRLTPAVRETLTRRRPWLAPPDQMSLALEEVRAQTATEQPPS